MRGRGGGGGAQDFKTAHLLGVCPRQQFGAMLIGSGASVLVSVAAYQLYTSTYQVRLWHPCAVIKFLLDFSINAVRSAVGGAMNPQWDICVQSERLEKKGWSGRSLRRTDGLLCTCILTCRSHRPAPHDSRPARPAKFGARSACLTAPVSDMAIASRMPRQAHDTAIRCMVLPPALSTR